MQVLKQCNYGRRLAAHMDLLSRCGFFRQMQGVAGDCGMAVFVPRAIVAESHHIGW